VQDADFIGQSVDTRTAEWITLDHDITPDTGHYTVNRHGLMSRIIPDFVERIALEQGQCLDHGAVPLVVERKVKAFSNGASMRR
jgi:hypothetical protein